MHVLSTACGESRQPEPADGGLSRDATSVLDAAVDDAGSRSDAAAPSLDGSADADAHAVDDAGGDGRLWVAAELRTGEVVTGEHLWAYDHRRWLSDPSDERTHAIFVASAYAEYPNDRSLFFVAESALARPLASLTFPSTATPYRDFLRGEQLTIAQLPLGGTSYVIMGNESYHLDENGYGDFAWDLVYTDGAGASWNGQGTRNEDYLVWDAPVLAPVSGVVAEVIRDAPDRTPHEVLELGSPNNMVGIHIGGSFYVYLLHFRQGTIPVGVEPGATVTAGTVLGRVGNSGYSLVPHLHMVMLWYDSERTGRTWSVPAELESVRFRTTVGGAWVEASHLVPETGMWLSE